MSLYGHSVTGKTVKAETQASPAGWPFRTSRPEPVPPTGQGEIVAAAIRDGSLRRPSDAAPSFVDLVCAVQRAAGASTRSTRHSGTLASHLFDRPHLVLVLVDGMGMSALRDPAVADLRERVCLEIDSVFPATTACAMTTVATGQWPGRHGVPGWWAYLAEHDLPVTVLPFVERRTGRRLRRHGVQVPDIWPQPSRFAEVTRGMEMHMPWKYLLSTFNRYLSGRCRTRGYRSLRHAQRRILRRIRAAHGRRTDSTVTFWYIPDYDSACHTYGVAGTEARATLAQIRDLLMEMAAAAPDDVRVAVTADHGLIDVDDGDRVSLFDGDPLLDCLLSMPSGEGRTPHFHVRPGRDRELVERVTERGGGRIAVLSQGEAEELRLFGPEPLSEFARRRFGDYVGIGLAPCLLAHYASSDSTSLRHVGVHGGMSPDEVRVPLVVL